MVDNILIDKLICGNKRFVNGKSDLSQPIIHTKIIAKKQNPQIGVICCVDSRVVPEIIFDQPLGTFLCSRVPGNVTTSDTLATVELAISEFEISLIVILAHTNCAAIAAACSNMSRTDHLKIILQKIEPAKTLIENFPNNLEFINKVSRQNAKLSIKNLKDQSLTIRNYCLKNLIKIISGIYDVQTGVVDFF